MGAESDQLKGKGKQVAGIVSGDAGLESEGKADRRAGEAKAKVKDATDKIGKVVETAKDKLDDVIDKGKDALHRK